MNSPAKIIAALSKHPQFSQARSAIKQEDIVARAVAIQQIPGPTFQEEKRAEYVSKAFMELGLQDIETDDMLNVYGWLPGKNPNAPVLLISAHTDTVFPEDTDLSLRDSGDQIYGPGLGDNSLGVSSLLKLAELFIQFELPHEATLCFLANTREEGMGNLDGMRAAIKHLSNKIDGAIVIEGMGLGRIYRTGIHVRRFKVNVTAPGGHSWLHFGNASAIHALMDFGHQVTLLRVPDDPRTSYNIGLIEGGRTINTIATAAACYIDLRSVQQDSLDRLEDQIRDIGARLSTDDVVFEFELIGSRPGGSIPASHPLVQLAYEAHLAVGIKAEIDAGSTDANILLAEDVATVCVGISFGGNAHRLDEYIETGPIEKGMWQLLLLAGAAGQNLKAW